MGSIRESFYIGYVKQVENGDGDTYWIWKRPKKFDEFDIEDQGTGTKHLIGTNMPLLYEKKLDVYWIPLDKCLQLLSSSF